MDPVRNPYAPGAGQRPPELAGRDRELEVFEVVLERVARARPERSLVLTGLRGVGKTVLLNTLRSQAIGRLSRPAVSNDAPGATNMTPLRDRRTMTTSRPAALPAGVADLRSRLKQARFEAAQDAVGSVTGLLR